MTKRLLSKSLLLVLLIWLITRVVFYSVYYTYVDYDEVNYLYSSKHLLEMQEDIQVGPVVYLLTLPFFQAGLPYTYSKLPFIFVDLALLLALYYICNRKSEKTALYASLFYLMAPMNLRNSYHVQTDMAAFLFFLLAAYFFVRYHTETKNKYLVYSAAMATLSGLTKEIIFCFYIVLLLYLLIQHKFIKRVNLRTFISTLTLIFISAIAVKLILHFLWVKSPDRALFGFLLDFLRTGSILGNGILFIVLTYFMFVNPVSIVLGAQSLKDLIVKIWKKKAPADWWFNYKLISILSFGVIALFFAFHILAPKFAAYLVPLYAIYAAEGFQKYNRKIIALLIGFAICFTLVIEYEQDSIAVNDLTSIFNTVPGSTIYTDREAVRMRSLLDLKTNKTMGLTTAQELPLLAKNQMIYAFTAGKDHEEAFDSILNKTGTPYKKINIYVAEMERYVYGIGTEARLPPPPPVHRSQFMQPIRTSIEERIFAFLIRLKARYCADPWFGEDRVYRYSCLWQKWE